MGRTGHPALIIGAGAFAVLAAGTAIALTRGGVPVARAVTTLGPARGVSVVAPDGASRPGVAGAVVRPGAVVTTGPDGDAELVTRGRVTMLGANAALAVVNGAEQQLRTGTAVVDARQGPGLTLEIASDSVVVPSGSATEADRSVSVRVGSLAGPAAVTNGSGRRLTLPGLWQVVVNGDALPTTASPLRLTDSHDESRAVPELVADDLAMKALARGIDTTSATTTDIVEASWSGTIVASRPGVTRGDRVLPAAIADASGSAGGSPQQRYDRVVGWREQGGSWGVVVHLMSSRASAVADALHELLRGEPAGTVGTISAAGPGATVIGGHHRGASTSTTSNPTQPSGPGAGTNPTSPGGSTTTPNPTPTPGTGLVGGLVNTLGGLLDKLLGILPLTASSPATPNSSTHNATPTPTPPLSSLLGGLTGH